MFFLFYSTSVALQASQQIMELYEAWQIHHGLSQVSMRQDSSAMDVKAIVKTWR